MKKILIFVATMLFLPVANGQRFVKVVNTIEQMAALNINDVHTNIYVADTNRGGTFTLIASSDATNNGTFIKSQAAGYRYRRQYSGPANVRWFGARGNDIVDDTTAIQDAVNCEAGSAYCPPGTYKISKPIWFNTTDKGLMGYGSVIKQYTPNTNIILICSNTALARLKFEDLRLVYAANQPAENTNAVAIFFRGPAVAPQYDFFHLTFRNLLIQGSCYAIGKDTYANVWGSFFEDIYVHRPSAGAIDFSLYSGASPNNYIKNLYVMGEFIPTGPILKISGQTCMTLQNCEFNMITNRAILLVDCRNTLINNFRTETATFSLNFAGIVQQSLARDTRITGLEVQNCTFAGTSGAIFYDAYATPLYSTYISDVGLYSVTGAVDTVVVSTTQYGECNSFRTEGTTSAIVDLLRWQSPNITLKRGGFPEYGVGSTNRAPITLQSSTTNLLTTPVDGSFEYDGTNLYFTVGATRNKVTMAP